MFGSLVREAREARALSLVDLGRAIGRDHSRVIRIERGAVRPSSSEVAALVRVLGLDAAAALAAVEGEWPAQAPVAEGVAA